MVIELSGFYRTSPVFLLVRWPVLNRAINSIYTPSLRYPQKYHQAFKVTYVLQHTFKQLWPAIYFIMITNAAKFCFIS